MTLTIEAHRESQEHANNSAYLSFINRSVGLNNLKQCGHAKCPTCAVREALAEAITYFLASACNESRP